MHLYISSSNPHRLRPAEKLPGCSCRNPRVHQDAPVLQVERVVEYLVNLSLLLNHRDPYLQVDQPATYLGLQSLHLHKVQAEATQISQSSSSSRSQNQPACGERRNSTPSRCTSQGRANHCHCCSGPEPTPSSFPDDTSLKNHEPHLGPKPRSHNRVLNPPGGKSSVVFY
ncbi:unnamed protein product [Oreochromis niloticus]|nr:unnamed protein product [Mustela putorius furo]